MENKQNLHTHTHYVDGKDTPEEMILTAIERGFDSIGFSDHSLMKNSFLPRKMTPDAFARYKAEVRALKEKYRGVLDVFCGLEYDFYSDVPTDDLDYLIGSVHYLDCDGYQKIHSDTVSSLLDSVHFLRTKGICAFLKSSCVNSNILKTVNPK